MKKFKKIYYTIIITGFIVFFAYHIYLWYKADQQFFECNYSGIIYEIEYIEGQRDLPNIKLNKIWHSIEENEAKIKFYIQISDSIVKESGTNAIKVFRKNEKGEWVVKVFK